jgi:biotin carboxylase
VRPKVAVLHHARSFFPLELFQQVGDEAELLWVVDADLSGVPDTDRLLRRLGSVVDIAGLDMDKAALCLADHDPDGIVSFVDDHLETAAALAARLNLPYHSPEVAGILVDKRRQREALRQAGVPGPKFWSMAAGVTPSHAADLARHITYPCVLKPAEGSGSRGIHLVKTPDDLLSLLAGEAAGGDCVVEEYLYDDSTLDPSFASYLSVESVISAGRVSHVAITGRFPLAEPFRETGNFIPGVLDERWHQPVLAMVDDAIDALGITTAVIHTEIKLTPDGPKLIEVNGRLGGRPPFVLRSVSDVNLFQIACRVAVGAPVGVDGLAHCTDVGFWLMLQPPLSARRVATVEGLNELSGLFGVETVNLVRGPGQAVDWREGTDSQVATVRGRVPDHCALAETISSIQRKVRIGYDQGGAPDSFSSTGR